MSDTPGQTPIPGTLPHAPATSDHLIPIPSRPAPAALGASKLSAGVEFDATFFDLDEHYNDYGYQSDWLLTLRGVLGYQATDKLLLQATAGAAWLDFEASEDGNKVASDTLAGWVIGAAAEYNLAKTSDYSLALRGDYLYANFEGTTFHTELPPPLPTVVDEIIDADPEMHQLRLGVVIRPN